MSQLLARVLQKNKMEEGCGREGFTYKMVKPASMWSMMSHKSSSIFSAVMAERDESLHNPPLHLIHMSICLLSMPLSKDY